MSPLSLLILASLVAALAFFLAGLLLASARAARAKAPSGGTSPLEADQRLRRELAAAEQALADAGQRHAAEVSARQHAEARRLDAERERDHARADLAKVVAEEKTLAERLRVAENENRAAFKREEEVAEMWAGQLDAAKVEQKRHDQALEREAAELRVELEAVAAERERLAGEAGNSASKVEAAAADAAELRARAAEAERRAAAAAAERARFAKTAEEAALREQGALERLAGAESATRAKLAELETSWQGRLATAEAAWTVRLAATVEDLRSRLTAAEAEQQALTATLKREQLEQAAAAEERETLALRVRAAEEVAEQRRQEAVAAAEARRGAEAKLKDYERLAQENIVLREQQAEAEHEARAQAGRDVETKDAKVELAAAQAKLAELESTIEENRRLRDEVAELGAHQEASAELERLQAAHKQVRLDAELMARRLQELVHERAELLPLRAQAAEAAVLAQEVEYLRRREQDLEAQVYAGGSFASRELPILSGEIPMVAPETDLETNLSALVSKGGPRTAVLADAQGFLIASAGESVTEEGLAAFAAVAGELVARARTLLPLADIETVKVTDANRMVLSCHLFASSDEGLGMVTLGPGEPPSEDTRRAIAGLKAIVAGVEPAQEGAPEPPQQSNAEPTTPAPS
jgi:hypothetical protein